VLIVADVFSHVPAYIYVYAYLHLVAFLFTVEYDSVWLRLYEFLLVFITLGVVCFRLVIWTLLECCLFFLCESDNTCTGDSESDWLGAHTHVRRRLKGSTWDNSQERVEVATVGQHQRFQLQEIPAEAVQKISDSCNSLVTWYLSE
jgi:hypothetical protein